MDMTAITAKLDAFAELLTRHCDRDTSADPDGWTAENPLWGHCAVVSLAAQDRFGGELLRASLEKFPKWAKMRSHYWNRFPPAIVRDLTEPQFGGDPPQGLVAEERTRAHVLSSAPTMARYQTLSWRIAQAENAGNALFENELYRGCYKAAMASPCQKMRFGCVLTRRGQVIAETCNGTIEPLKHRCEPTCIRLGIQSRTESMLGACGHAEEFALWEAAKQGVPIDECDLYVAGVHMNGRPWLKARAEHTCLRCANQMHNAGILRVFVPVGDRWESVTTAQALAQADAYANKEKSV
jgi:deoxycytidylate deaminase